MSVTPSSTVVGVFRDRSMADQAVNALQNAGFAGDQIQYVSSGASGSFLEGLKSLFTGTNDSAGNLTDDLTGMGLSDAEAQYYSNEYNNGHTILVVRAAERGTEAMNILRQYGAYNAGPGFSNETAATSQQPADYVQQSSQPVSDQYNDAQDWGTSSQPQAAVAYPSPTPQQDDTVAEQDVDEEDTQPITPVNQAQDTPVNVVTPQPDTGYQASQAGTTYNEQSSELPPSQPVVATPRDARDYQAASEVAPTYNANDQSTQATPSPYGTGTSYPQASVPGDQSTPPPPPGYETGTPYTQASAASPGTDIDVQPAQTDGSTPEQTYAQPITPSPYDTQPQVIQPEPMTSSQDTGMQSSQTGVATPEQTDDLEQLQAQLQSLQQQLQQTKARLQAARERENQLKAVRERQQQVQAARQQVQDLQAELQATMAELQDVHSRLAQYQ